MSNTPRYDVGLMRQDMDVRGWLPIDLSRAAKVSDMSVYRFLNGGTQTAPMAKKLAAALGKSVRRYLVTVSERREGERRDGDRRVGAGA